MHIYMEIIFMPTGSQLIFLYLTVRIDYVLAHKMLKGNSLKLTFAYFHFVGMFIFNFS